MREKAGGVVLVREPQFDKIAAKVALERFLGYPLPVVSFWPLNEEPDDATFQQWIDSNIVPIDLGRDKYHGRGTGSALESIMVDYEIPRDSALQELLEMVNKNNLTGYLKGFYGSITWTLRELYKLGKNPQEVIDAVSEVIDAFLDAAEKPAQPGEVAILERLVGGLVGKDFLKSNFSPFTIPRYMRDMWRLGVPVEEIIRRAQYFADGWQNAQRMRKQAQDELLNSHGHGFEVFLNFELGPGRGGLVKTDSPYISRELVKKFLLVAIKNSEGNVRIQTTGGKHLRLGALCRELEKLEPGRWFHDPRLPACFNGSRQYLVPPTGLAYDQLVELVQRHARFATIQHGQRK